MKHKLLFILTLILSVSAAAAENDGWTITATSYDTYTPATIGNGRIGITPDRGIFQFRQTIMANVYDRAQNIDACMVPVQAPDFNRILLLADGKVLKFPEDVTSWKQVLNMKEASVTSYITTQAMDITYKVMALRNMPYVTVMEIELLPHRDVALEVQNKISTPGKRSLRWLKDLEFKLPVFRHESASPTGRVKIVAATTFFSQTPIQIEERGDSE